MSIYSEKNSLQYEKKYKLIFQLIRSSKEQRRYFELFFFFLLKNEQKLAFSSTNGLYNFNYFTDTMEVNIQNFTQEQLLEKPKRTVYEKSKKKYSKITKDKIFQYKLANTVYQCVVNESAAIQKLPMNTLDHPDLQLNLKNELLFP